MTLSLEFFYGANLVGILVPVRAGALIWRDFWGPQGGGPCSLTHRGCMPHIRERASLSLSDFRAYTEKERGYHPSHDVSSRFAFFACAMWFLAIIVVLQFHAEHFYCFLFVCLTSGHTQKKSAFIIRVMMCLLALRSLHALQINRS